MRRERKRIETAALGIAVLAVAWGFSATAGAQPLVAPTEALSPTEQQKLFHLPPGFEIQLVASEPDVNKPMNLKFDAHGRLWVSHSLEYPFPAKDDTAARDAITVFSDLAADGKARGVRRFAEKLNIPIGVLPLNDREVLAWSVPNIYRLIDTDGDGVADERKVAFGTYGFIDTHGNQNAFTRWIDDWIYANHGFNNHSQVKLGGEGDVKLEMRSGNTYRYRADGSAIELFSAGQVNPFGLSFDALGNLFSADCHSRPTTMLLREGHYQSFGRPHDGLGFAPETTDIDHGGTGIAGVAYYAAEQFPPEFRDVLFVGNVITNRVLCDRLEWTGSSPRVAKIEDFVTCDDPWFRPVDLQLGPDGALYIADFYNCIIGHYEVPLTHPRRDRERGRIWRVVYRGDAAEPPALPDISQATADELAARLGDPNLTVRMLATNTLLDRFGNDALKAVLPGLPWESSPPLWRAHALWIVARTQGIGEEFAASLAEDRDRLVRVHLARALAEAAVWEPWHYAIVHKFLTDADPFVRRAAVTALAMHPSAGNLQPLFRLAAETPAGDAQLVHAARIALRDQLRSAEVIADVPKLKFSAEEQKQLLAAASTVPTGPAALLIYEAALRDEVDSQLLFQALPAMARLIDESRIDPLVEHFRKRFGGDPDFQFALLRAMHAGLQQRGLPPTKLMSEALAELLTPAIAFDLQPLWTSTPLPGDAKGTSPWALQQRNYRDGQNTIPMMSSLLDRNAAGERLTGLLRSPEFVLPAKMSFWMCGHNGAPGTPDEKRNYVRLVLVDGTEVARSYPPRHDVGHQFDWDLKAAAGKRGHVEVVDGSAGDAFAWIAVSRFDPPVIRLPSGAVGDAEAPRAEALRHAGELKLTSLTAAVKSVATNSPSARLRLAAGEALIALEPTAAVAPLAAVLSDAAHEAALRQRAAEILGRVAGDDARTAAQAALMLQLRTAPQPVAVAIAAAVAGQKDAAEKLLTAIKAGQASPTLLREPAVVDRLRAAGVADLDQQIEELTAKLSPADDRIAQLIAQRRAGFLAGKFDVEAGRGRFARGVCANCHRVGEVGKTIGPALDGIGNRGLDRLLEDLLDPNRNVDQAFRTTVVTTDNGQVLSGFGLREDGESLLLFDNTGKQLTLPRATVEDRQPSTLSPMPSNISEQMKEQEFYELLAFLLQQRAKPQ